MKRLSLLLTFLMLLVAGKAVADAPITQPEAGKEYYITHSSGMLLSWDGSLKLLNVGEADAQKFVFEPVDGVEDAYYARFVSSGKYLATDGAYSAVLLDSPTENAQVKLEVAYTSTNVTIRFVASGKCLGSDDNNLGTGVYTDKGGNDGKHLWNLVDASAGVITTGLETAIADAEGLIADATIGTAPGNFPQSAADALNQAIMAARAALSATTQDEINAAVAALEAAIETFKASEIQFTIDSSKSYVIMQYGYGNVMSKDGSKFVLATLSGEKSQQFKFLQVEGAADGIYNLQEQEGMQYVARDGSWSVKFLDTPTADDQWIIELLDAENSVVNIRRASKNGYLGTDGTSVGSSIYTNKGNGDRGQWQLIEYVEGQLLTKGLEMLISEAEKLASGASVGADAWKYPQSAVDALNQAIAVAKSALSSTTQEEINAATDALKAAITAFNASQNKPTFEPVAGEKYRFSVAKYSSNYMAVVDGKLGTAERTAGDANQLWEFEKTETGYKALSGGKALANDFSMVDPADAPSFAFVYTNTSGVDKFAFVQADAPTKALTFGSGKTPAFQDLVATNNAHQGRFVKADLPNDPDRAALEEAIYSARNTLSNIDRGPELGQWSDDKCEAFEAEIVAAESLKGATQNEVDAMTAKLKQAEKDFKNNPNTITVDKTELDKALKEASDKVAAAKMGVEVGEYLQSEIESSKAKLADFQNRAKTVKEQDECDALTKEVQAFVESLTGHKEKQSVKTVLDDYIVYAEALYDAQKDNVGIDKGQRPQSVVDAFKAAIDKAKGVENPTIADLDELVAAHDAFMDGAMTVDRTALRAAIEAAAAEDLQNLVAGEYDGNYPQEKIDAFAAARKAANDGLNNTVLSQEDVTKLATDLTNAIAALKASKVVISFTALDAAVAKAEPMLASTMVVGDGEGECPQSVIDTFKAVIDKAKAVDRKAIKQADVDALATELTSATTVFRAALVESTGLDAEIEAAQALIDNAVTGMKPGNYPTTAVARLTTAIETAQALIADEASTQQQLIDGVTTLKAEIEKFKSSVIAEHDLTALTALIAEVKAFLETHTEGVATLKRALVDAEAVVANPNDYTKSEVKKVQEALQKAYDLAKQSGVSAIALEGLAISSQNGLLVIRGLEEKARVQVFALSGSLAADAVATDGEVRFELSAGGYVVSVVNADGHRGSRLVTVK